MGALPVPSGLPVRLAGAVSRHAGMTVFVQTCRWTAILSPIIIEGLVQSAIMLYILSDLRVFGRRFETEKLWKIMFVLGRIACFLGFAVNFYNKYDHDAPDDEKPQK